MRGVTHSYVWLDPFVYVTWLVHVYDVTRQLSKYLYDLRCVPRDGYLFVTWLIRMYAESHIYAWCDSFICVTWLIHIHDMTRLCATWLTHVCDVTRDSHLTVIYLWHVSFVCHGSCICVMGLIHMCDGTDSYVWWDSFICVTWLIHMCDMTHSYVWHDSFICVMWLIHMYDVTRELSKCVYHLRFMSHMTLFYLWRGSFVWVSRLICMWCVSFRSVTWLIQIYDVTHSYVRHDSLIYMCVTQELSKYVYNLKCMSVIHTYLYTHAHIHIWKHKHIQKYKSFLYEGQPTWIPSKCVHMCKWSQTCVAYMHRQPIADRVAQNLEIISKTLPMYLDSADGIYD